MTFPTVRSSNTSGETAAVTTHTVSLPATVTAGDLIEIEVSTHGTPTITQPTGYALKKTLASGSVSLAVFLKVAGAGEGGTTVTFTTSAAETSGHVSKAIQDWSGDLADVDVSTGVTGNTDQPNPDSVTATWGADDNLFIAIAAGRQSQSVSVWPTSYTGNQLFKFGGDTGTASEGSMVASATRALNATSDDPSAFTFNQWKDVAAATLVIKPAAAALSLTAPDTVTHGVSTTATGNFLSTVTGMTLEYGTVALSQSFTLDGDDLDFTPDVGVPTAYGTGNAVDSLPLTPDHTSSGITPYQVTLDVTDGTASDSRNVTNVAAGAVQTFQVMEAGVNKTAGEGLGGSDLVTIENNHQVTVPLVVDGVTITIDSDTLDYQLDQTEMAAAGNSITFDAVYYSPAEEQASKIAVTVTAPGGGGAGSRTMTAWIEANGAGGQVNDAWITYLKAAGASGMTFNELMFSWLGGLGYTGSLSDRVAAWSKVSLN